MTLTDIIIAILLFFSFIGGLSRGAIKTLFSFLSFIIAIAIAGRFFLYVSGWLNFLPGPNWPKFAGFFVTLAISGIILSIIFYFPQKITEESWDTGILFRLLGGILNLLGTALGLVILTILISNYPVWDWLQQTLVSSALIQWLIVHLGFIQSLMPEVLRIPSSRVY